jgi:hypothetical protein
VAGERLRNVTDPYRSMLASRSRELEYSSRVELGQEAYAAQIVEGFYQMEDRFRWMSKRGVVRVRGPRALSDRLEISGRCPGQQLTSGPLRMTVSVDGHPVGTHVIDRSDRDFTFRNALPPALLGRHTVDVAIEVERTISTPNDERRLGLVITTVSVGDS